MPVNRKLLGAAAFSLALAGGGAAGALLGTPSPSGAQDDTTDPTTEATDDERFGGPIGHHGEALATAAEALGMSEDELRAALADGSSIAQVAEAQGVDVQTVIDALVAHATERLDELEASLPERMSDLVNREGWGDGPGLGGPGGPGRHLLGEGLDAAAEALGMTSDELRSALQDGSTLAEVAEASGVDVQTVIDALVAEATAHLDEALADGRIDEERAAALEEDLVERITDRVNNGQPERGRHGGMPPAGDEAGDAAA